MVPSTLPETAVTPRKRNPGRPRSFPSPKDLEERGLAYIEDCVATKKMPTKSGLAIFMGVSRDTVNHYQREEGYSDIVKKIYDHIEEHWTQSLMRSYPTGSIFYLKNSFGWADRVESTMDINHNIFFVPKEIAEKHKLALPEAVQPVQTQVIDVSSRSADPA